ncbi:FAD-binding protein [uncultured Adlercreutzia sp.]|uniref:FAD-binding protein n=1 Tax=uncultured Adlercreutzia sp. TaxID=875803 RepID=UPI0025FE574D|nr:FAD-binding protein [uncultured Adlercreutzia sp.]MCI9261070.1 FAD-binding protein [Eggerthellaceae bacterium]
MEKSTFLDRRGFLKGAAVASAAAAAASLTACAPGATSSSEASAASTNANAEALADTGSIPSGYVCVDDWLGAAPSIADDEIVETIDVDVVVLGGGHAGTQAALGAAQGGASVAVIEIQPEETFNCFGDDICAYNSQFMIDHGYGPYDTGEIIAEYHRRSGGRANPQIISLFVENSGEMFDNLMAVTPDTSNVFELAPDNAIIQIAHGKDSGADYPIELSGYKAWASTLQTIGSFNPTTPIEGREEVSRLTELETYCRWAAEELGAQWFWEHSATVLDQNEQGDVVGAIAQGPDGYRRFNAAKGVILCTGDFSSNADMVYNLLTDVTEWGMRVEQDRSEMTGMGRDGVGLKLGCWAGGMIEPQPRPAQNFAMWMPPGPWGTTPFLYLNAQGKRYVNEAMAQMLAPATFRQPLGIFTAIADANYMDSVKLASVDHGAPNWGVPDVVEEMNQAIQNVEVGNPEGGDVQDVSMYILTRRQTTQVYAANTLEELLGFLGYEGDALQTALASIDRYNELCEAGVDSDFGKDAHLLLPIKTPPFYGAVRTNDGRVSAGLVTMAGLVTDEHLNVLQSDHTTPIKGLYAAGNCLGQRYGNAYATPSAGNSMGMAMTHGRVAGKIVAAL